MVQNKFKRALSSHETQFGLWCTLSHSYATEVIAGAGYDWILIDTEHSPADPLTILPQLQTIAAYPSVSALVRPAANDPVLIKRVLDIGAQTLLIPYVQSREEVEEAVRATRYPPHGIRGVSALTRATRFGREKDYFSNCSDDLCVIVQIETQKALDNLDDIAETIGVDALFIGPADLAASLGFGAEQTNDQLRSIIIETMIRIKKMKKPVGILTSDPILQRMALEVGVNFMAIGVDSGILARGSEAARVAIKNL